MWVLALLLLVSAGRLQPARAAEAAAGFARASPEGVPAFAVVAYVPEYRMPGLDWDVVAARATDLVLFSLEVTPKGELTGHDRLMPATWKKADAARQRHGTRLHFCIGGAGRSEAFQYIVRQGKSAKQTRVMKTFGKAVLAYITEYSLDGVVFDWEGQRDGPAEKSYGRLLGTIRHNLRKKHPGAVTALTTHPGEAFPTAFHAVDYIHLMSYDSCSARPCQHATLGAADAHVRALREAVDPAKIILGVPGYGRATASPDEAITYAEVVRDHGPLAPDADQTEDGKWYFNGVKTTVAKVELAAVQGLAGIFLWEAGQDSKDEATSLLANMRDAAERLSHLRGRSHEARHRGPFARGEL
jgi:GH18 family chitinase